MKGEELINLCQAVDHGNARFVRNTRSKREGAVLSANGAGIEVKVGSGSEIWRYEECEEVNPAPTV